MRLLAFEYIAGPEDRLTIPAAGVIVVSTRVLSEYIASFSLAHDSRRGSPIFFISYRVGISRRRR